ncbi:GNAT family N-acetyltransferase [Rhodovarius crocodyli]|uniref:GNAT family N-acetyltransferase n=1 Tax=Rhodovarius crocodyli TaxID=1979269 RepID=A0A437M3M4_9PROT|nr:GNAT family N-acetyltransferase [Rhodovarius crocodyli]RVT92165.1 GNAT family N-acetyltransferase [Rhodovarius crocodyli]
MIRIRRATAQDAAGMGLAHVASWRSTYAGILPEEYLVGLSAVREAAAYERGIARRDRGHAAFVAVAEAEDMPPGSRPVPPGGLVVAFTTAGHCRRAHMAEGEIETLYVLDDWREQGLGRRLLRAASAHLNALHCRNAMAWVLADNPNRFFYEHLGARPAAEERIMVGGQVLTQRAMLWDPVVRLMDATARSAQG